MKKITRKQFMLENEFDVDEFELNIEKTVKSSLNSDDNLYNIFLNIVEIGQDQSNEVFFKAISNIVLENIDFSNVDVNNNAEVEVIAHNNMNYDDIDTLNWIDVD
ncbi:hypothetical protein [Mycoplasma sp. P36-A1]|uniref:hypothetical protein n=1 Tax=Mycoplasma sp. P36-A1 TaxID=3252900 RepID=UPI003C2E182B